MRHPKISALAICVGFLIPSLGFAQDDQSTTTTTEWTNRGGGLFVEPMIAAQAVSSDIGTSAIPLLSDTSGKVDGAGVGLRLGGHIGGVVFLAADARYNRDRLRDSSYGEANADAYNYGVTLGAQTPYVGIRVWGTGILGGQMAPEAGNSGLKATFKDASGYRVGLGFHVGAVALNAEYQDLKYNTSTLNSIGSLNLDRDTNIGMTERGPILNLSFPVEL